MDPQPPATPPPADVHAPDVVEQEESPAVVSELAATDAAAAEEAASIASLACAAKALVLEEPEPKASEEAVPVPDEAFVPALSEETESSASSADPAAPPKSLAASLRVQLPSLPPFPKLAGALAGAQKQLEEAQLMKKLSSAAAGAMTRASVAAESAYDSASAVATAAAGRPSHGGRSEKAQVVRQAAGLKV